MKSHVAIVVVTSLSLGCSASGEDGLIGDVPRGGVTVSQLDASTPRDASPVNNPTPADAGAHQPAAPDASAFADASVVVDSSSTFDSSTTQQPLDAGRPDVAPRPVCGDGYIDPGEDCDDGNTANGDCCTSSCRWGTLPSYSVTPTGSNAVFSDSTGTGSGFDLGMTFTVSFMTLRPETNGWVQLFENANGDCPSFACGYLNGQTFCYYTNGTKPYDCNIGPTDGQIVTTSSVLQAGRWYRLTYVRNGQNFSVYVDGVLESTSVNSNMILPKKPIYPMRFGRINNTAPSASLVSDIAVWKKVLTPSEIADLSWGVGARPDLTDSLALRVPLNEGTGTVARDITNRHSVSMDQISSTWSTTGPTCGSVCTPGSSTALGNARGTCNSRGSGIVR